MQVGSDLTHDYQITNDDTKPEINFTASSGTAAASSPEEADGTETITVSLAAVTGVATSVAYSFSNSSTAVLGTDFTDSTPDYDSDPDTKIITWAADDATRGKTIVITFTDDTIDEGNETIIIELGTPSGGAQGGTTTTTHTITLQAVSYTHLRAHETLR